MNVLVLADIPALNRFEKSKLRDIRVHAIFTQGEPLGNYRGFFTNSVLVSEVNSESVIDLVIYSPSYKMNEERIKLIQDCKKFNVPFLELHETNIRNWGESFLADNGAGAVSLPELLTVEIKNISKAVVYKVTSSPTDLQTLQQVVASHREGAKQLPKIIIGCNNSYPSLGDDTGLNYFYLEDLEQNPISAEASQSLTMFTIKQEIPLVKALVELPQDSLPEIKLPQTTGIAKGISTDFFKKD